MAASHQNSESLTRGARMLRTALGPAIARFLEDPAVVEVMLNPDGRLWTDRLSEGLSDTGERLAPADGERIVRLVAHHVSAEVHAGGPRVSAELPETGDRFLRELSRRGMWLRPLRSQTPIASQLSLTRRQRHEG